MKAQRIALTASVATCLVAAVSACSSGSSAPATEVVTVTETTRASQAPPSLSEAAKEAPEPAKASDQLGDCSAAAVQENPDLAWVTSVVECDGHTMFAGAQGTDQTSLFTYNNGSWIRIPHDGRNRSGAANPCYLLATMDAYDIPQSFRNEHITCNEAYDPNGLGATTASSGESQNPSGRYQLPACDGRNILIVTSVVGAGQSGIDNALSQYPGSYYTEPGHCSSLRGSLDGQAVYPIYYDFGSDVSAMCSAKAQKGGNARTLNNNGDFTDPC